LIFDELAICRYAIVCCCCRAINLGNPMTRVLCLVLLIGLVAISASMARDTKERLVLSWDRPGIHHSDVKLALDDQKEKATGEDHKEKAAGEDQKKKAAGDQPLKRRGPPGPLPPEPELQPLKK
jgi:hypothetical protein